MSEQTSQNNSAAAARSMNAQITLGTVQEMSQIAEKLRNRTGSAQDQQRLLGTLDPQLNTSLKQHFNEKSGIAITGQQENYNNRPVVGDLQRQAIRNSDAPENINTLEKYIAYNKSPQQDLDTVKALIRATPAMTGFTLSDAVALAGNDAQQRGALSRFPQANPSILMATAYTLLDNSKAELAQNFPAFAQKHQALGTDFSDTASLNIFYSAQDDQKYKDWEHSKRAQIIDRIANDPIARQALSEIKSPLNTKSTHDIIGQYDARTKLAGRITEIFADVYDLKTLSASDVKVLHKSVNEYLENGDSGFAWDTKAGVKNDELVILNHNPVYGLLLSDNPETTDHAARANFLSTAIEELQHTTDNIYADKLVNRELDSTHPAFNHTSLMMLNLMNYTRGDNQSGYNAQIRERSAKEVATDATHQIMTQALSPQQPIQATISAPPTRPTSQGETPSVFAPK